ncbi:hypothetical protein BOTNAR_0040g00240 [Botryotinia narcissicola]|uniref:Uncharacterized protein n=1 Tax=Botryotinia narcissicola TaxID=278944 RepID=A0A4Z1J1K3_9HELO|nr:hypothetical protein BOTNAR_0040g00240 [Botryotinia narcissicola]
MDVTLNERGNGLVTSSSILYGQAFSLGYLQLKAKYYNATLVINPFLSNDVTKPLSSSPSKENGGWSPMPIAGTINFNIMDSWNPLH